MDLKIDRIIKTKRRTIVLEVQLDSTLIVRAPIGASEEIIKEIIYKHQDWIEKKKKEAQVRNLEIRKRQFKSGESFLYLGKYYKLEIVESQNLPLKLTDKFYLSKTYLPNAEHVFLGWYKGKVLEKISGRVEYYARENGYTYNKIKISNACKRWGSCSIKGNLSFSWRLIMAPPKIIDYVVVHELTHLMERNHSEAFWRKIALLMPDYKEQKKWLKENGHILDFNLYRGD